MSRRRSLRLHAVLIAGISLTLLWLAAAAWMMQGVHTSLERTLDGRLAMSARMVAGLLDRAALAPSSTGMDWTEAVRVHGNDSIACEIRSLHGEILARTDSGPHSAFQQLPTGYSTREVAGDDWRVYILDAGDYQITTAERIDQRTALSRELLKAAGLPFLIALFGALAALWLGIGRGLAPLRQLSQTLREKTPEDTTPVDIHRPPAELRPVIDALNGLLGRLARTLGQQRAFTDAAAHELRTPLTVIDTHLQVLRLTQDERATGQAQDSLDCAEQGVHRLRRTLEQMMTLARAEAGTGDEGCESVQALIHDLLAGLDEHQRQRITLQVTADAATAMPRSMLETALRNLLDNALRYSPPDSPVDLRLAGDGPACLIEVADRGPGLSAEQAVRIGQRFWRGDQGRRQNDGAGLGISIVRATLERFSGTLQLQPRDGGGLCAQLRVPARPRPAPAGQQG